MALPESLAGLEIPELARQMNEIWWRFDREYNESGKTGWESAQLNPLPATGMAELETEAFPAIATRIEEVHADPQWVRISLGFDPGVLKLLVSNAHKEWPQEQKQIFLSGQEEDCAQVWCINLDGEWKIIGDTICPPDIEPPVVQE